MIPFSIWINAQSGHGAICKDNTLYRGVPDGGENVQLGETSQRVDGLEGSAKRLVEYVTDSCATTSVKDTKDSPEWVDCGNRQHLRAVIHFTHQQAEWKCTTGWSHISFPEWT